MISLLRQPSNMHANSFTPTFVICGRKKATSKILGWL